MEAKRPYFIGIGGIGMSALAQLMQDMGARVSGSDREESPTTELLRAKGIEVRIGQEGSIPEDADLVIYSEAVWEDNPDRMKAKELGTRQSSYFTALGEIAAGKRTIAVAGTHGKTTTTGMLAKILADGGASPSAIVGSIVRDFGSNYLRGESDLLVVEACEYKRDFLTLRPHILVVTNIEFDHTDYYADLADVQKAFRTLMEQTTTAIVTDATHPNIAPLLEGLSVPVIDYKKEPAYETKFPGEFNRMNARAAASAARAAHPSITDDAIASALASFQGTWRRFEYRGKTKRGADVYDDYAHHPTAVRATLAELRKKGTGKIYVAFHPHLYSRTRDLLADFATAFTDADRVIIAPIYPAREIDDGTMSNALLAAEIAKHGVNAGAATFEEIRNIFETEPGEGDIVMTMGAGDIYKVADELVA